MFSLSLPQSIPNQIEKPGLRSKTYQLIMNHKNCFPQLHDMITAFVTFSQADSQTEN